ncbi:hypothetical protein Bbelb_028440 [Branchiostoma belcheri]|nr:hypothetical protein Bbelb_028440 [Branchiostoma belcheri]
MNSSVLVGTAQATKYASIFEGRSAGECRTLCGTSLGRVRDVLRESAIRSAGECGTSSGRVRTSRDGFLASVEGLHARQFSKIGQGAAVILKEPAASASRVDS